MKKIRKITTILTMLLTLALVVPMTGNAASPAEQAKKSVHTFFQAAKNLKVKKMEGCLAPHTEFVFQEPYELQSILRPYCRQMTWKVKGCKVRGNRAVVTVRVDYENLKDSYWYAMDDILHYMIKNPYTVTEKVIYKRFKRYLKKDAAKYGSVSYYYGNLKIHLSKIDGKWKITEPTEELLNIVSCGLLDAMDDFLGTDRWAAK